MPKLKTDVNGFYYIQKHIISKATGAPQSISILSINRIFIKDEIHRYIY